MTAAPLTTAPLPAATLLGTTVRLAPFRLDRISGIRADVLAANASVSAALAAHAAAREALDTAAGLADESGVGGGVLATGSVFTAAEVRQLLGVTDV